MVFLPDPGELDSLAEHLAGHAAAARERADRLGAAVAALDWHGVAATAFGVQAQVAVLTLRHAANRLDDAADALHRHAARIRSIVDDMKTIGIDSLRTAEDLVRNPRHLLTDARHLIADGAGLLGDALGLLGL